LRSLQLSDLEQPGDAAKVWADAGKHHKNAYIPWLEYTRALEYAVRLVPFLCKLTELARRQSDYEEARKAFAKAAKTQLDWPEMIWETWLAFEHSHGSVGEIQYALDVVERTRTQVEARRAKVLISS
jgi:hypothetical protein